jgi:uncharacterized Zn-finger protein
VLNNEEVVDYFIENTKQHGAGLATSPFALHVPFEDMLSSISEHQTILTPSPQADQSDSCLLTLELQQQASQEQPLEAFLNTIESPPSTEISLTTEATPERGSTQGTYAEPISSPKRLRAKEAPNVRKYPCPVAGCSYKSNWISDIHKHKKSKHSQARQKPCPNEGCDKSYKRTDHARRHAMKSCHLRFKGLGSRESVVA